MGQSPAAQFQSAAKGAVNKAIESQAELTAQLQGQAGQYLGKKAPSNYAQVTGDLKKITGYSPEKWIASVNEGVYPALQGMTTQARSDLKNFQPGLIGSESTRAVTDYLQAAAQDFEAGIEGQSQRGGERLKKLPGMAVDYFTASSKNPAFENMLNQQAMSMAEKPNTISQDANFISNAKRWMTYNV